MTKESDTKLIKLIKLVIAEINEKKKGKTSQPLGESRPIKMNRQTYKTQIRELKDRLRIKKLEKEIQSRDFKESNQQTRDALMNFLNTRNLYEDDDGYDGPIIEEIDDENYYRQQPPIQQRTQGFSMSDSFGAFGQTPGSDRFLMQRSPFQIQSRMNPPPLELTSPQDVIENEMMQQPLAYTDEPPEVFGEVGNEPVADFGVDPYEQADAAMPYFDASEEPAAVEDIELPQVIGGRQAVTRAARISQLRSKYRDLAGLELNPTIYQSTKIRELEPAIRGMLLRNYQSLGGSNPQVLKSKKIGLIETEIKNLKDAINI
jgi:hypothetical protein